MGRCSRGQPNVHEDGEVPFQTIQLGRGADIFMGKTGTTLCPLAAVLSDTATRGSHPGPFFITPRKTPLTKQEFVAEFHRVFEALGLPTESYAGHSFCIGAAMSAVLAGVEDATIQLLRKWQSAAILRYIRTPQEHLAVLSAILANQHT